MQFKKFSVFLAIPALALAACSNDGGSKGTDVPKEEFVKGFTDRLKTDANVKEKVSEDELADAARCVYDKVNGKIDVAVVRNIADGKTKGTKLSLEDQKKLVTATRTCMKGKGAQTDEKTE